MAGERPKLILVCGEHVTYRSEGTFDRAAYEGRLTDMGREEAEQRRIWSNISERLGWPE